MAGGRAPPARCRSRIQAIARSATAVAGRSASSRSGAPGDLAMWSSYVSNPVARPNCRSSTNAPMKAAVSRPESLNSLASVGRASSKRWAPFNRTPVAGGMAPVIRLTCAGSVSGAVVRAAVKRAPRAPTASMAGVSAPPTRSARSVSTVMRTTSDGAAAGVRLPAPARAGGCQDAEQEEKSEQRACRGGGVGDPGLLYLEPRVFRPGVWTRGQCGNPTGGT